MSTRYAKYADPAVIADLVDAIEQGGTVADACLRAGIHERTWRRWWARAVAELARLAAAEDVEANPIETPFVEFHFTIERARAGAKLEALATVRKAIRGWDDVETIVVEKKIVYVIDGVEHEATQTTTTTKSKKLFAWAAAMTWLERRYPGEFARLVRNELTGAEGGPISVEDTAALKARIEERLDEIAEKRRQHEVADERASNGDR